MAMAVNFAALPQGSEILLLRDYLERAGSKNGSGGRHSQGHALFRWREIGFISGEWILSRQRHVVYNSAGS